MEPPLFLTGAKVWLHTPRVGAGQVGKQTTYWRGPWTVVRQISPWTVLIYGGERDRETVVNVRRLKPWKATLARENPVPEGPEIPEYPHPSCWGASHPTWAPPGPRDAPIQSGDDADDGS
ncbi:unnamed protein product [Lampetra fluviatilis]